MRRLLAVLVSVVVLLVPGVAVAAPTDDLLDRLKAIPGLTVVSESQPTGYRFFVLTYRLPGEGFFHSLWRDGAYDGPATGPVAAAFIRRETERVFAHWEIEQPPAKR